MERPADTDTGYRSFLVALYFAVAYLNAISFAHQNIPVLVPSLLASVRLLCPSSLLFYQHFICFVRLH